MSSIVDLPRLPKPETTVTISKKDEQMVEFYTTNDRKVENQRVYRYQYEEYGRLGFIKVHIPDVLIFGIQRSIRGAIFGGVIGGAVGGGVGLCVGGPPVAINGAILGAKIGGAAGGALGAVSGVIKGVAVHTLEIKHSTAFIDWKIKQVKEKVYPIFRKYLKDTDFEGMEGVICPISMDVITIPVWAPDGDIYDKDSIEQWIDQVDAINNKKREDYECGKTKELDLLQTSPKRSVSFGKEDLRYDQKTLAKIYKKATEILKKGVKLKDLDEKEGAVVVEGMTNLAKHCEEVTCSVQKGSADMIIDKFNRDGDAEAAADAFKNSLIANKLEKAKD